jgi:murein DD-endopeptidase MepM/ murein hydrolase activator NlpD
MKRFSLVSLLFSGLLLFTLPLRAQTGPQLRYSPADLEWSSPQFGAVPGENEVAQELSELLRKHAPVLKLLNIKIKNEKKLLQKVLDLDAQFHFLNLKSLQKVEKKLNLQAWGNLYQGIRAIRQQRFDLTSLEGLQKASDEYRTLTDLAEKSKDTAKAGKYGYFLGLAKEGLASLEKDRARKKERRKQARDAYQKAYNHLKVAPETGKSVVANDALEKLYTLDQDFGGILPLVAPPGRIALLTSDLGPRLHPRKKKKLFHKGIDLANAGCNGWVVQSIGAGRVVKSGWEKGYGYVVNLQHEVGSERLFTKYAHLKKEGRIAEGTVVAKGTPLGFCNNTGVTTGTHLHFELLRGGIFGTPVDPKPYLPTLQKAQ